MKEEHGSPGRGKCGQKPEALKMQRAVKKPGVVWCDWNTRCSEAAKAARESPEGLASAFTISPTLMSKGGYRLWSNHFFWLMSNFPSNILPLYNRNNLGAGWVELCETYVGSVTHRCSLLVVAKPTFCAKWLINHPVWPMDALLKRKVMCFVQMVSIMHKVYYWSSIRHVISITPSPKCSTFLELPSYI